jgi:hypothetical protein
MIGPLISGAVLIILHLFFLHVFPRRAAS